MVIIKKICQNLPNHLPWLNILSVKPFTLGIKPRKVYLVETYDIVAYGVYNVPLG